MGGVPLWVVFVATLLLVLVAVEIGYRIGLIRQRGRAHEKEAPVGAMVGAALGLFAFLLAFTFGFAANLFQAKRDVLLEEANAIGTAYLRADFLPQAERRAVRELLREYVDVRLAAAQSGDVEAAISRSAELHAQLWTLGTAGVRENPDSIVGGLFIQALNELIDLHAKRVMVAVRSRIPPAIWIALYAIAFFALGTMGYHSGLAGAPRSYAIVAVAFSAAIWLITDLDTAQEGSLRVSQQTMVDVRESMDAP